MGIIAYSCWLSSVGQCWHLPLFWNQGKCTLTSDEEEDLTIWTV